MKRILWGALIVLLSFTSGVYAQTQKSYQSANFHFSVNYPPKWEEKDFADVPTFFAPKDENAADPFRNNLSIIVENLPAASMSVDEYVNINEVNAPKIMRDYHSLNKDFSNVANQSALINVYEGTPGGRKFKFKACTFIKDGKAYTMTYTGTPESYDVFLSEAEEIMQSLTFDKEIIKGVNQ